AWRTLEAVSRRTPLYPPFVRGERKRAAPSQSSPLTKGGYRGVNSHRPRGVRHARVTRSSRRASLAARTHCERARAALSAGPAAQPPKWVGESRPSRQIAITACMPFWLSASRVRMELFDPQNFAVGRNLDFLDLAGLRLALQLDTVLPVELVLICCVESQFGF